MEIKPANLSAIAIAAAETATISFTRMSESKK
jgi:hypothetical protein